MSWQDIGFPDHSCSCGCATSPPPPPPISQPGCVCPTLPPTLYVEASSSDPTVCGGWGACDPATTAFEPFTLAYGTIPPAISTGSAWVAGPYPYSCVLSTGPESGDQYWVGGCDGVHTFNLTLWRVVSSVGGGKYTAGGLSWDLRLATDCGSFDIASVVSGCTYYLHT